MVIRHNLSALNTSNVLNKNYVNQAKSNEKLASGLRINRAADDAAGLAISQKMHAKVRALTQAQRNIQDGISLIQVADGALSEIQDCIIRIKELSAQALNGTYSENDRQNIQLEIGCLLEQIDKIANETKFNNIAMLDGSYDSKNTTAKQKVITWLYGSWLNDAALFIEETTGWKLSSDVTLNVTFKSGGGFTVASMAGSYLGNNLTLTINTDYLPSANEFIGTDGPIMGGFLADRVITHELVHGFMFNNVSSVAKPPMWFIEGLAEAVHGASDDRFPEFEFFNAANINDINNEIQSFDFIGGNYYYQAYTIGYIATSYLYNCIESRSEGGFKAMLGEMRETDETFEQLVVKYTGVSSYTDFIDQLRDDAQAAVDAGDFNEYFLKQKCNIDLTDGKADPLNGKDSYASDVIPNFGSEAFPYGVLTSLKIGTDSKITVNWDDESVIKPNFIVLQVGDKLTDFVRLHVSGAKTTDLSINGISVNTAFGAKQAITACDNAIDIVSKSRAEIGARQNSLQHLMNNLSTEIYNTQVSESRIRDADMAKEMSEFVKNKILIESAQFLLSQANMQPNNVLNLIK